MTAKDGWSKYSLPERYMAYGRVCVVHAVVEVTIPGTQASAHFTHRKDSMKGAGIRYLRSGNQNASGLGTWSLCADARGDTLRGASWGGSNR